MSAFYFRLIARQWRLNAIRLFCIAVALATAVTFSITLLSDRLEQLFEYQSKEVLAADLLLRSTSPLSDEQQAMLADASIKKAETISFQSMASTEDLLLLSSVKAVSGSYPLRGELQVAKELFGDAEEMRQGPAPGEAWVEDRVIHELEAPPGSVITVGDVELKVTRVLLFEPDRGSSFYSFTPRILMHIDDIERANVLQLGSRARYDYLFSGEQAQLDALEQALTPSLQANQEFVTIESANQTLATALERAYRFLRITALIAVLLGAVGVALVSYQYATEMTYQYAVLRCLGLRGLALRSAIVTPFVIFTLLAVVLGLALGGAVHELIIRGLGELIPVSLPAAGYKPFLISSATAIVVVFSFAWPFLRNLIKTPPKMLLTPVENREQPLSAIIIAMLIGLFFLVQLSTGHWLLSLVLMAGLGIFMACAYWLTRWLIKLVVKRSQHFSVKAQLSARILKANRRLASLQIVAIAITFFSLALIQTLRDDLIDSWQAKVPENAPNFFAINLFDRDVPAFQKMLSDNQLEASPLYPVVRGRLIKINDQPVKEIVSKESQGGRASNRDLSLTWANELPEDNVITKGQWHLDVPEGLVKDGTASVSVERELAENLKLELGDQLQFVIETRLLNATVTSIREVQWESFAPNFYMMFDQKGLESFPVTWLSSFHMTPEKRSLLPEFVQRFSGATFFDVDFLLNRIRGIVTQVSFAVESVLYFALLASLVVFVAIELILHHSRLYTTAVFKAVGSDAASIESIFRLQFIITGALAGSLAYGLNSIVAWLVATRVLEGEYVFNPKTLVLCLVVAPLLVLITGVFSIRRTRNSSARQLLASE